MDEVHSDKNHPISPTTVCQNEQFENLKVVAPPLNCQDLRFNYHRGSAPHISVTESTPETQRKFVSHQLQVPTTCATEKKALVSNEEDNLIKTISHGQRGRMEDQRCNLDLSKSAPCSPQNTQRKSMADLEMDPLLNLLVDTQSSRLDDQRVFLPSLPGLQKENPSSSATPESSYLCYMVSKVQGSRMDDQRCSLPQIITTESSSTNGSERTRSASFCTNAEIHSPKTKNKSPNPAEQEGFYNMISKAQRRRMEDQRCELKVTPKSARKQTQPEVTLTKDSEAFFNQLASSQGHRLDDQRVSLPSLPGIQNGERTKTAAATDASYLCYMVSKVQGSRMDEQRCSAPFIFQNMGSSSLGKDSDNAVRRSASLNRGKESQHKEPSQAQQDQFLKMMKHAQKGRMEEQRCSLPSSTLATTTHNGSALNNLHTGAETEELFRTIATSQARRLDDQRAPLPVLPAKNEASHKKQNSVNKENAAPQITVTQSTPTTSRKDLTRPVSKPQGEQAESGSPRSFPKSASYGQDVSPPQVTVRVSMSFSSLEGLMNADPPSKFPELFLTLGAPGDNLMIPLSPMPGRRLSLSLNLVPKEDMDPSQTSSSHPSPRKSHSGPSSPKARSTTYFLTPSHQETPGAVSVAHDKKYQTQTVKDQMAQVEKGISQKGQKIKGTGKDKPAQEKGKNFRKDKSGNKHK